LNIRDSIITIDDIQMKAPRIMRLKKASFIGFQQFEWDFQWDWVFENDKQ
jgi:hypothetical protein